MTSSEGTSTASHLPTETRLWPLNRYTEMHRRSLDDIERFWAEVEDAAIAHPAVAEVAVASKPDEIKGEALVLFVTLKQENSPSPTLKKEITKYLRQAIGPIATPDEIYFVDSMPKTRSGKIMRRVLKAVASGQKIGDLTTLEDEASIEEVKRAYEGLKKVSREGKPSPK